MSSGTPQVKVRDRTEWDAVIDDRAGPIRLTGNEQTSALGPPLWAVPVMTTTPGTVHASHLPNRHSAAAHSHRRGERTKVAVPGATTANIGRSARTYSVSLLNFDIEFVRVLLSGQPINLRENVHQARDFRLVMRCVRSHPRGHAQHV
jgi:hypothetical protein